MRYAVVVSLVLSCLLALPAQAAKKALIIGNAAYTALDPLQNTVPDAQGYREAFDALGYAVSFHTDLGELALEEAVIGFVDGIAPGDEVAFVYAGHGWSAEGVNYLIPVDAPKQGSERLLARRSLALKNGVNGVLDDIAAQGASLSLAIIDACRDNPFASNGTRSVGNSRGLAQVTPRKGSFVIYSAGEGQTALDRLPDDPKGQRYSVFTRHFLPLLTSGLYVEDAISETQLRVSLDAERLGHQQQPAYYDQTLGKTCLKGTCRGTAPDAAPSTGAWFAERKVPAGVYLFGEQSPLVRADGSRFFWPVTTQKRSDGQPVRFGDTVEVFDTSGKRVAAFVPEGTPQAFGLTPGGAFYTLTSNASVNVFSESGGVAKRVPLSKTLDLVTTAKPLSSGKLRVLGAVGDSFDEVMVDIDPETGAVSEPVWRTAEFITGLRISASGHFAYAAEDGLQLFDPQGGELGVVSRGEGNWSLLDFALSPLGVFLLQYERGSADKGTMQLRLRHRDWLGSVVDNSFEVDVSDQRGWEVMSLSADALGVVIVAVLDGSHFEVRRLSAFGDTLKWRAVLPWDRTVLGPPISVTQLSDGGAALVQYPYLPDGVTDAGDVLRLTRIGPKGDVPDFGQ